jgi:protein TonB
MWYSSFAIYIYEYSFLFHKEKVVEPYDTGCFEPIVQVDLIDPPNITPVEPIIQKREAVKTLVILKLIEIVPDNVIIENKEVPDDTDLFDAQIGLENIEGPAVKDVFSIGSPIEVKGMKFAPPVIITKPVIEKEFLQAEIMPEFEGGVKQMYKWLGNNLRYPVNATYNGIQCKVIVTFIIEKDGQISNVKVLKGIGIGCDEEAERVINEMPKWNAGMQNGTPVRVRYTIPLSFQIRG